MLFRSLSAACQSFASNPSVAPFCSFDLAAVAFPLVFFILTSPAWRVPFKIHPLVDVATPEPPSGGDFEPGSSLHLAGARPCVTNPAPSSLLTERCIIFASNIASQNTIVQTKFWVYGEFSYRGRSASSLSASCRCLAGARCSIRTGCRRCSRASNSLSRSSSKVPTASLPPRPLKSQPSCGCVIDRSTRRDLSVHVHDHKDTDFSAA